MFLPKLRQFCAKKSCRAGVVLQGCHSGLPVRVARWRTVAGVMRWLVFVVAALSLACLLAFADDSSAAPRKKIVRRVLGWDSMRFRSWPALMQSTAPRHFEFWPDIYWFLSSICLKCSGSRPS